MLQVKTATITLMAFYLIRFIYFVFGGHWPEVQNRCQSNGPSSFLDDHFRRWQQQFIHLHTTSPAVCVALMIKWVKWGRWGGKCFGKYNSHINVVWKIAQLSRLFENGLHKRKKKEEKTDYVWLGLLAKLPQHKRHRLVASWIKKREAATPITTTSTTSRHKINVNGDNQFTTDGKGLLKSST